jgi:hypothetical protein
VRAGQQRIVREDKTVLRSVALLHAVVLAVLLFGGLIIQLTSSEPITPSFRSAGNASYTPAQNGYLEVVADPWAEVHVDGIRVETTPFANPIPLAPGVHYVKLVHPIFNTIKREIIIESKNTVRLVEKLATKNPASKRRSKR